MPTFNVGERVRTVPRYTDGPAFAGTVEAIYEPPMHVPHVHVRVTHPREQVRPGYLSVAFVEDLEHVD